MSTDIPTAIRMCQAALSGGLILEGLEALAAKRIPGEGTRSVVGLFSVRIALAVWLMAAPEVGGPWAGPFLRFLLILSSLRLTTRAKGPLCGGSDSMFFQVQLGLFAASMGFLSPLASKAGLAWIAAQSLLSYFLAGVAKARVRGWWDGAALQALLSSTGPYVIWEPARRVAGSQAICAALGWIIVAFELCFPLILALPDHARPAVLAAGLLFHFSNALVLGLNRFVWAWAATYPALLCF